MTDAANFSSLAEWAEAQEPGAHIKPVICDLNGIFRGKRLPVSHAKKIAGGGLKLPLATLFVDIWGRDVIGSGHVLETGDVDGVLQLTERGVLPITWQVAPVGLAPVCMSAAGGGPYGADPRNALAGIVERYRAHGLTPVCATELEFYLYDPAKSDAAIAPPVRPDGAGRLSANAVYSVQDLDKFNRLLDDVYAACDAMNIPADAAISENGCGQFEINLTHRPDALRAADDAQFFKYVVKGVAEKHGLAATFMAKPYGGESGSGFHTHFSVLDEKGDNIFSDGGEEGSALLRYAVGGLLKALPDTMLVFAPHANSYRRLREGTHAPVNACWGYDNRTAPVRIPSGPDISRRIEHRVAGADANPYLVLAAVLGAALAGIENKTSPGDPLQGNAYAHDCPSLPATWHDAISRFGSSPVTRALFGDLLVDVFTACKKQEFETLADIVPQAEYEAYLETV